LRCAYKLLPRAGPGKVGADSIPARKLAYLPERLLI
jgi:hypothetical protein